MGEKFNISNLNLYLITAISTRLKDTWVCPLMKKKLPHLSVRPAVENPPF